MNNIIYLQGKLIPRKNPSVGGGNKLTANSCVFVEDLIKLKNDLIEEDKYWKDKTLIEDALIDVEYKRVVPKSKRISSIIFSNNSGDKNEYIRGARFEGEIEDNTIHHIITYYVPKKYLLEGIEKLNKVIEILNNEFKGKFNNQDELLIDNLSEYINNKYNISKSCLMSVICDCNIVQSISHPQNDIEINENKLVSLYEVDDDIKNILSKLNIKPIYVVDKENTALFSKDEYNNLKTKAPYLITQVVDLAEITNDNIYKEIIELKNTIPEPTNEPFVGVIDTGFDKNVYFKDWVDVKDCWNEDFEPQPEDYTHGTEVSSIIVDGPNMNPELDDECGRFQVRHFQLAYNRTNSMTLMSKIEDIVKKNKDIKVWNLSLGSSLEINKNSISIEASILDRIMSENGVIFVISGTNDLNCTNQKKIGAPADSINGIVVNAVNKNNKCASYTRVGKVLSFFNKPDIAYYGGDINEPIIVCEPLGEARVCGTSFAAPWITRKMAYLVYRLNMPVEVAKAIIIDSATNWDIIDEDKAPYVGFGVIPIKISDIINSKKDEIKFYIYGFADEYDTYTYNIPVPTDKEKCPYIAKATLCYLPKCSRKQGVDYTNTELDIYFGRVMKDSAGKIRIKTINDNKQSDENTKMSEGDARQYNRKWDNVKHIVEKYKDNARAKKVYENGKWGLSVKLKDRLGTNEDRHIPFGVVITLKEINGVNRYDEFIRQCTFNGWIVNKIDVENSNRFYVKSEEEVIFE